MQRMVVVLPAPFGPRKPVTLPGSMPNVRSSTAVLAPYRFVRPRTSIMGNRSSLANLVKLLFARPCREPFITYEQDSVQTSQFWRRQAAARVTPGDDLRYSLRVMPLPAPPVPAGQC